jgi:hypothetical protein
MPPNGIPVALRAYKYLPFPAAQPEGLSGHEINWLSDYLLVNAKHASSASLRRRGRARLAVGRSGSGHAAIAINRRGPPAVDGLIYFTAEELARRSTTLIEQLEGDGPEPTGLPAGLQRAEIAMLLRRAGILGLAATPGTLAPPQPICRQCLLRARNHLEDAREPGTARQTRYATEWMVVNEPHGLRHHAGHRNRQRSEPGHRHRHPSQS